MMMFPFFLITFLLGFFWLLRCRILSVPIVAGYRRKCCANFAVDCRSVHTDMKHLARTLTANQLEATLHLPGIVSGEYCMPSWLSSIELRVLEYPLERDGSRIS